VLRGCALPHSLSTVHSVLCARCVGVMLANHMCVRIHAPCYAAADACSVVSVQLLLDVIELTEFSAVPVTARFSLPRLSMLWKQLMSRMYRGTQAKALVIDSMRTVCTNIVTRYLVPYGTCAVGCLVTVLLASVLATVSVAGGHCGTPAISHRGQSGSADRAQQAVGCASPSD
jgi:hypothetical protein